MTLESIGRERAQLVAAAKLWLKTPFHDVGRVRGPEGGADCLTFIAGAFEDAGLVAPIDIPAYSPQWHLHRDEERYVDGLLRYCDEVAGPRGEFGGIEGSRPPRVPLPGDIVMWRFARCFSHGAIAIAWPLVQHSYYRRPNGYADAEREDPLAVIGERRDRGKRRPRRFFCLKRWNELTAER